MRNREDNTERFLTGTDNVANRDVKVDCKWQHGLGRSSFRPGNIHSFFPGMIRDQYDRFFVKDHTIWY